ncbi:MULTISPECIES: class I adenylate-forming enzyme family protein [unclassified Nocardia]|uniref:class I adenylate-forming enzyme family protein n=1 Tax=unclassified Nocardia TaxID=2637762 RepID=UPI0033AB1FE8
MTQPPDHPLSTRIRQILDLAPDARAIEFDGTWFTWDRLAAAAHRTAGHVPRAQPVGILLRNRPEHVAAFLGVLLAGGTVVVINPARGDDRIRDDITALDLPLVIGNTDDLTALVDPGATTLAVDGLDAQPGRVRAKSVASATNPVTAVRMLTSGTTGPPKRVDLTYDMLWRSVLGTDPDRHPVPTAPRTGVAIVNAPLVHIGGVFRVLQCVLTARPFVFLPRFELDRWAAVVREHRPGAVSLVPAALRMVLHSDLTADDLAGVRAVTSGTAPLSAADADAFQEKFGIPVLTSYAATEFGGGVAGWTLADHRQFWQAKRGSVGRASGGALLRVVADDGTELGTDRQGLLEVIPGQLGPGTDWIRTTDLARIDADGFLWILGRADQAIIRGGFKIMPDEVRAAIEAHPAVRGAAVVARPDHRLGETPVAMVELRPDRRTEITDLLDHLRTRLARYEIPTDIALVDAIPRTPSGKPDLSAVRAHFADTGTRQE